MEVLFIWELSSLGPLGDSLLPLSRLCGLVRSCISIDLKTRSLPCDRCTKFITPLFNVLTTWHLLWHTLTQKPHCVYFLSLVIVHLASDSSPFVTCVTKRRLSARVAKVSHAVFKILPPPLYDGSHKLMTDNDMDFNIQRNTCSHIYIKTKPQARIS